MRGDSRGQAYTLEGLIGAIFVLTALFFGLQVVDVGPWTSTNSDETERLEIQAQDALDLAAENGSLSRAVRCYGNRFTNKQDFGGAQPGDLSNRTELEQILNQTLNEQGHSYNLYFKYWNGSSGEERVVVSSSQSSQDNVLIAPSDSAAVAVRTVTLYDTQQTRTNLSSTSDKDCGDSDPANRNLSNNPNFYQTIGGMNDIAPQSPVYNIVEVRLVVW